MATAIASYPVVLFLEHIHQTYYMVWLVTTPRLAPIMEPRLQTALVHCLTNSSCLSVSMLPGRITRSADMASDAPMVGSPRLGRCIEAGGDLVKP